jgi:hypothetical protein
MIDPQFAVNYGLEPDVFFAPVKVINNPVQSRFTGDFGITPNIGNDFAVINLISQMGDNPSNPKPAIAAIAVWLANRWAVYNLSDLRFTWNPPVSYEVAADPTGGSAETFNIAYLPGYFTAVSKNQDWVTIPARFAQYDDGRATYYLAFLPNAEGKPTFGLHYANPRSRGWFKEEFLPIAIPLLAITSLVFDFSGQAGYAILGLGNAAAATTLSLEIALVTGMTQLQVAQLVGSAAIGAVTSGGDVGKAIENAAAAYVGSYAGTFVAGAVNSAAAGEIAAAAVTAGAQGQDVGQAILMAGAPLAAGAAAGAAFGPAAGATTTGANVDYYYNPRELDNFVEWGPQIPTGDPTVFYPIDPGSAMPIFDYPEYVLPGDVLVGPAELGIIGDVVIDDLALTQTGLDPSAVVPDDLGILYNQAGQWVEIPAEQYAAEVYAVQGPDGGLEIFGPDDRRLLTTIETSGRSDAEIQALTLQKLQAQQGLTTPAGTPPAGRPANLTQPASQTTMGSILDFSKVAEALTRSFGNIALTIRQIENGSYGRVPSPYGPTSPYGTLRPPQPGVPVRNVDGSVTVNNGNGTQTKTLPTGQQITTSISASPGGFGSFGGVSSNTLLLVGAGLAAALLLRRK